jgi:Ni/Fe-hydrogenase subunit HybB-like protein
MNLRKRRGAMNERKNLIKFILSELKPKGPIFTPFNVITAPIILIGLIIIILRFLKGLGAVTNLSQEFPWGLWIAFDVMTGIPWAGGAFCMVFLVYVMHFDKYKPIVRAAVLSGLLAYSFYAGALILDLGRWWNALNPFIGNKFGFQSVLWLIAFHFLLYTICAFLEFAPIIAEWLSLETIRKLLHSIRIPVVILGVTLSTLHQSGIGALTLMAKGKIHPLWWSEFTPILFFLQSIFGGMSMLIFEGSISHRVFSYRIPEEVHEKHHSILIGLARGCAGALFAYLALKFSVFIHVHGWEYIISKMGGWYLVEVIGFGLIPLIMLVSAVRQENIGVIRIAAFLIMLGILINRFNYVFIAYKWYLPLSERYYPSWMEIWTTVTIVLTEIWILRWIINRMPVYVIEKEE